MKRGFILVLLAVVMLGAPGLAQGEVFVHKLAGLQFEIPNGWKTEQSGDSMEITAPDDSMVMWIDVIKPAELDAYIKDIEKEADKYLKNAEVTEEATTETVNGLTQTYAEGTADLDGQEVDWDLTIVQGGKMVMAILAAGEALDDDDVETIYKSIKKN